ncbi:L-serine ammonia-lyase, iron-sulfur-dependent, subunit alpha [Aminipila sp.]|uniref:L-serine ammonia-lyase, iron-sulfur-dependent, subunit alpha n=1 Tax=Aminipila sp. TaxID=2060095 RepID=UPI001DF52C46|nr:L-serine ammonia-lyase, iron-sulfur-dependent, subunit alpha [Aminipila sp.]MBE6033516.1 L-serine ammonia-lyase, iron-sulfur-dependent, subunit alpha [Clostridiales bacterium]
MYRNIKGLLELAQERKVNLSQIVLDNETKHSGKQPEEILDIMKYRYEVMKNSTEKALRKPTNPEGNLICGIASAQYSYTMNNQDTLCGSFINLVMARALSSSEVNASMGKICAMPTAGSCGIVPAVVISVAEKQQATDQQLLMALITASGLGAIVTENATVAGAEGGCQAECGVAAAMAAAAAVELCGGTPSQAITAFSLSLMNIMGLVCDPVGGLVQIPCAQRNASQAVNALLSADLAMAGVQSYIDADEVVEAMYKVGKLLPVQLKETALGGIAATCSGACLIKTIQEQDKSV